MERGSHLTFAIPTRAVADDAVPLEKVFALHVAIKIKRQRLYGEGAAGGEEQDGGGKMHAVGNFDLG
jgi:hypothetical protein